MKNSLNHLLLKNGQGLERSATAEEVEVALAALEVKPGIYFGVDAGIDGLHPFQATLVAQAALQFDIYVNGIDVQAHSKLGHRLLSTSEVGIWVRDSTRGSARSVQESLKQFLALFEASENILLAGAFQFDSHKLHSVAEPACALLQSTNPCRAIPCPASPNPA